MSPPTKILLAPTRAAAIAYAHENGWSPTDWVDGRLSTRGVVVESEDDIIELPGFRTIPHANDLAQAALERIRRPRPNQSDTP